MIKAHDTGVAVAAFAALMHAAWSLLVFSGYAESWISFVYRGHFLDVEYAVLPFSVATAASLIIASGIAGYILGYIFASVWNWTHR